MTAYEKGAAVGRLTAFSLRYRSGRAPSSAAERQRYVSNAEDNIVLPVFWRTSLLLIGIVWPISDQYAVAEDSGFPEWLGGKPDVNRKTDRCGVYEWFFSEADSQTEGAASKDELASMRVINIANKLVDHHVSNPVDSYGAEVKFLVIGRDHGPFHFKFHISNAELEGIMNKGCGK